MIAIDHLTVRLSGFTLRDINLTVNRGERIVICGPSGSGKSTFIRCINRLEEHQKGKILVDGIELTGEQLLPTGSHARVPLTLGEHHEYVKDSRTKRHQFFHPGRCVRHRASSTVTLRRIVFRTTYRITIWFQESMRVGCNG